MLGRAVDGAYGYGTDIGGYFDLTTPVTTKELFLRWPKWAALSPIFRLHGSGLHGTHTPWSYDAQTVRVYESLSRLHLRAVPADHEPMARGRPYWDADSPARCGSPTRGSLWPGARIRSGCWVRTCSWRRS